MDAAVEAPSWSADPGLQDPCGSPSCHGGPLWAAPWISGVSVIELHLAVTFLNSKHAIAEEQIGRADSGEAGMLKLRGAGRTSQTRFCFFRSRSNFQLRLENDAVDIFIKCRAAGEQFPFSPPWLTRYALQLPKVFSQRFPRPPRRTMRAGTVGVGPCLRGWLMLSLSGAAGTNNTQGEMINTSPSLFNFTTSLLSPGSHTHTHTRMCIKSLSLTHTPVQYTDMNVKQREPLANRCSQRAG